MAGLQEYKCPCCGGSITFDSSIQKMKCPYCDTEFEMETLLAYDAELKNDAPDDMNWSAAAEETWQESDDPDMCVFVCNSCGGEIVGDKNTAATSCPFCGNPVVMMGRVSGELKPDLVVPFKLDKEAAKKGLREHLFKKRLLPKVFKDENHIDEVKGIYVPFWLFDAEANANMRYRGTRTRFWSDMQYNYTETSHFSIMRAGSLRFEAVPVDGSSHMPNDLMESIEPYDLSEAVDFQTAYLAGYFADKYDVTSEDSVARANERIKASTESRFADTISGYVSVTPESGSVRFSDGKTRYALLPVWLLNTTWNGQKYTFAMNGQTGRFVGDLPLDKSARFRWMAGITAVGAAILFGIQYLAWLL